MSSIESAFADGPFGSGVKSEPDKPEPSEPATTTEPRDAASETPEPVKADSGAGARDERDDEDGEGKIDGPPGSEGLQKALKSERSLRREQRKGLSEALKRSEQLEAQNRQFSAQLAAMQQQMAAAAQQQNPQAQEKKPDDWDELLTKGPAYVQERINQAFAERDRKAEAERLEQTKKRVFESRNRLLQREPDAREFLTEFVAMAKADPRLEQLMLAAEDPADYAVQYAKEAKRIAQFNSIDELVAAERAKWEAERAQSGTPAVNGQREATGWSAPKTLAGRRGGGASVTPASGSDTAIESLFRF